MKDINQLYAIDTDDQFTMPIFAFGEKLMRETANRVNKTTWRGGEYRYIAKVRIERSGAFEYFDVDGL